MREFYIAKCEQCGQLAEHEREGKGFRCQCGNLIPDQTKDLPVYPKGKTKNDDIQFSYIKVYKVGK